MYDPGATSHMSPHESEFSDSRSITPRPIGVAAQGVDIWADRIGNVSFDNLKLKDVLYCKELTGTTISVGRLCDDGYREVFSKTRGYIIDQHDTIIAKMTQDPTFN